LQASNPIFSFWQKMEKEEKDRIRYGLVNFERRKHPRFNVDFPAEYRRAEEFGKESRTANASQGGLLLYLQEQMEVGQYLVLRLFFPSGSKLESIEATAEVVWVDLQLGKEWKDYRVGVTFADISPEGLTKLMNFLGSLSG
jgi:hypothetical protein